MNLCKDCKFWSALEFDKTCIGICSKVPKYVFVDGKFTLANKQGVYTNDNFGCVLFEKK